MEKESWKMAEAEGGPDIPDFPCLHRTTRGRIFLCRELRRVVIDFLGSCLVLRLEEFRRLHGHFLRLAGCGWTRSRMEGGERIRLRDATGGKALLLGLPELLEMSELMENGASRLDMPVFEGVWRHA